MHAAGDDLDTGQLLVRQSLVELLENRPAVAVSHPDNCIGVVVNDDGDVLSVCSTKPVPKSRTALDTRGERFLCFEFDEMDGI